MASGYHIAQCKYKNISTQLSKVALKPATNPWWSKSQKLQIIITFLLQNLYQMSKIGNELITQGIQPSASSRPQILGKEISLENFSSIFKYLQCSDVRLTSSNDWFFRSKCLKMNVCKYTVSDFNSGWSCGRISLLWMTWRVLYTLAITYLPLLGYKHCRSH